MITFRKQVRLLKGGNNYARKMVRPRYQKRLEISQPVTLTAKEENSPKLPLGLQIDFLNTHQLSSTHPF